MKFTSFFTLLFIFFFNHFSNAQFLNNEDAKKLKQSHFIVGLTNNDSLNEHLLKAVENSFILSDEYETLPIKDAIEKLKTNENITIIQIGTDYTSNTTQHDQWETVSKSSGLYIGFNTKGKKNANLMQYLNSFSEAQFIFGLTLLQDYVNLIVEENLKGMSKVRGAISDRNPELEKKTLYINQELLNKKTTIDDVKASFKGKVKKVSQEEFDKMIIEGEEDAIYIEIVRVPVGDTHAYLAYLISSDQRICYDLFSNGKKRILSNKTLSKLSKR